MFNNKSIKRGMASKEHGDTIGFICEKFNALPVPPLGNYGGTKHKNKYFPDAMDITTDFEIEMVPSNRKIKDKQLKWDITRQKVLVLRPTRFVYNSFDEIYIFKEDSKKLIKVK